MVSVGAIGAVTEGAALAIVVENVCVPAIPLASVAVIVVKNVPALVYSPLSNPPAASVTQVIPAFPQSSVFVVKSAELNSLAVIAKVCDTAIPSTASDIEKDTSPVAAA